MPQRLPMPGSTDCSILVKLKLRNEVVLDEVEQKANGISFNPQYRSLLSDLRLIERPIEFRSNWIHQFWTSHCPGRQRCTLIEILLQSPTLNCHGRTIFLLSNINCHVTMVYSMSIKYTVTLANGCPLKQFFHGLWCILK